MTRTQQRRGITLTEILISILIMGVGMVSLMTLFPLGMLRIRDANRLSRSGLLTESATGELEARDLLNKSSFLNSNFSPWYTTAAYTPWPYDPWIQDTPAYGADPIVAGNGAYRGNGAYNTANNTPHNVAPPNGFIPGPGLPVAYDPLWRYTAPPDPSVTSPASGYYLGAPSEARFASGIGFVRPDPNVTGTSKDASAHGLQRITNFSPFRSHGPPPYRAPENLGANAVPEIFVSPEDIVLQSDKEVAAGLGPRSPIVPDLLMGMNGTTGLANPQNDWNYTWMFTGQQSDCTNGSVFVGDIVIFEKRPFALDPLKTAFASNGGTPYFASDAAITGVAAGETVVEAIFGYTGNVAQPAAGGSVGYGSSASRAVLLRWSDKMPDPEIRAGMWIADVTYERNAKEDFQRRYVDPGTGAAGSQANAYYPYQRCYWYQIAKRTNAAGAANSFKNDAAGMREMTVWVSTPLRALTLLALDGSPFHVNAALVSPYVVNVFPRTIYTR